MLRLKSAKSLDRCRLNILTVQNKLTTDRNSDFTINELKKCRKKLKTDANKTLFGA